MPLQCRLQQGMEKAGSYRNRICTVDDEELHDNPIPLREQLKFVSSAPIVGPI